MRPKPIGEEALARSLAANLREQGRKLEEVAAACDRGELPCWLMRHIATHQRATLERVLEVALDLVASALRNRAPRRRPLLVAVARQGGFNARSANAH